MGASVGARRRTRVFATATTFGLWVKVPVTFLLVVNPALVTVNDLLTSNYTVSIGTAFDLFMNVIIWAVCIAITASLWRSGERPPLPAHPVASSPPGPGQFGP